MADNPVWEVAGGGDKGGILVRNGKDLKSEEEKERLSTGALVRQLELAGGRLSYVRLTGSGPRRGWVSTKLKDKDLLVLSDKPPPALPVLAVFYSGGFTAVSGRRTMEPFLKRAREAGFADAVVLDHVGEPGFEECKDFEDYNGRCEAKLDEDPRCRGRPVAIFAHSHGCVGGYGLARRLGGRCTMLYAVARRPPDGGLLDDVWGVDCGAKLASLDDEFVLTRMLDAWPNEMLEPFRNVRPLPEPIKDTIQVVKRQYSSSVVPVGSADAPAICTSGDAPLCTGVRIQAIVASREQPAGETAAKMAHWERFSGGAGFSMSTLDSTHMGIMDEKSGLYDFVINSLLEEAQLAEKPPSDEPPHA